MPCQRGSAISSTPTRRCRFRTIHSNVDSIPGSRTRLGAPSWPVQLTSSSECRAKSDVAQCAVAQRVKPNSRRHAKPVGLFSGPRRDRVAARHPSHQTPGDPSGTARKPATHRAHHEIEATHCACGPAFERIGAEFSETRLRAGPIFRAASHPRQVPLIVLQDDTGCGVARANHRRRHPRSAQVSTYALTA